MIDLPPVYARVREIRNERECSIFEAREIAVSEYRDATLKLLRKHLPERGHDDRMDELIDVVEALLIHLETMASLR